eukprot:scaffold1_cov402-Prasinococcus_capsulatus_cf.AAC.78
MPRSHWCPVPPPQEARHRRASNAQGGAPRPVINPHCGGHEGVRTMLGGVGSSSLQGWGPPSLCPGVAARSSPLCP